MRIIELEQGSPEWLKFRQTHITATDIRSLLGICPFKGSPLKVWESKCLGKEPEFFSSAAERGTLLEPSARAWIEDKLGMEFPAAVVESVEYPWAMASLDGINHEHRLILELKCGGKALHEKVVSGKIPEHYLSQVQWQLLCTGYESAIFVSFMGLDGHYIRIKRDQEYIDHLVKVASTFWNKQVLAFEAPEPGPNDWVDINTEDWKYAAQVYRENYELKKQAENQMDAAKAKLEALAGNSTRVKGAGLLLYRTTPRGNIDYSAFVKEKGLEAEAEAFRKSPVEKMNVRLSK